MHFVGVILFLTLVNHLVLAMKIPPEFQLRAWPDISEYDLGRNHDDDISDEFNEPSDTDYGKRSGEDDHLGEEPEFSPGVEERGNEEHDEYNNQGMQTSRMEENAGQEDDIDQHQKSGDDKVRKHSLFGSAFLGLQHTINKGIALGKELETLLNEVFQHTVDEALQMNGTSVNSTEEEVNVDGQNYTVHKSIVKAGDSDNSILVEAIEAISDNSNRTKRSNWLSEDAEGPNDKDP